MPKRLVEGAETMSGDQADHEVAQTPLVDLLRAIPADARLEHEQPGPSYLLIPVGKHSHEAADTIDALRAEVDSAEMELAVLRKSNKEACREVERLRQAFDSEHTAVVSYKGECGSLADELCVCETKLSEAEAREKALREALLKRIASERLVAYPGENPSSYRGKVCRSQLLAVLEGELETRRGEGE
jgi:hypothetical protein